MRIKPKNWLVDLIFKNVKIISLLFLFLVIFGAASVSQMQRQGFPEVLINVVSVNVVYPNASANQVEDKILKPMEEVLSDIESIDEYRTIAGDSFGSAVITFDQKADLDEAFTELKNEISTINFPEDAKDPRIEKFSVSSTGDFIVGVSGYDSAESLFAAGEDFEDELKAIDGVKSVKIMNPITPEILITFRQEDLIKHEIRRADVEEIIRSSQFSAPVGSFIRDEESVGIILEKEIRSVDDIQNILIRDGLHLRDVATVTTQLDNNDHYNRIGFRRADNLDSKLYIERALLFSVKSESDADILLIEDDIVELLSELESSSIDESFLPDGKGDENIINDPTPPEYVMLFSQAESTRLQLEEITQSVFGNRIESLGGFGFIGYVFGGLGLVVLLLFLFMNIRVAILAATAIPLSLFFATIYLNLIDVELNTLVLFSMVLTIGLVVDPTIVFLESLQRFKQKGYSGRDAAAKTMQTVGLGIFLAVATNILVFVPFGVVSGFFGQIIKFIPLTIIPAMMASMIIPVLFYVPLASKILSSKRKEQKGTEDSELIGTWRIARFVGTTIKWLLGKGKVKVVLRILVFLFIIATPALVGFGLIQSGSIEVVQFSSQEDSEFIALTGDVTSEWTFEKAVQEVIVPVQNILVEHPEIKNFSFIEQNDNSFTMFIQLLPIVEREEEGLRTSDEVAEAINNSIKELNLNTEVHASTESEGPPQDEFPIRVRLFSEEQETLRGAVEDVTSFLSETEGVDRVDDNISKGSSGGSVTFILDNNEPLAQNSMFVFSLMNERLAKNNLGMIELHDRTFEIVSEMVPNIISENQLTDIRIKTQEEAVYEQALAALIAQEIENPEELLEKPEPLFVRDLIAETRPQESVTIQRVDGKQFAEVYASISGDADALQVQSDLEEYLNGEKLEELGLKEDAVDFKGEADSIAKSFSDLFLALGIAIFLIYVLLVGFFRSYLEPFIILFAIPLGLVGVFLAVAGTTGQLGFLELLGVVAMAGIVVNVTILLIDYANQLKRQGKSPADAISTSVAVRFRPIVLTQLTAFGSLIPLVYLSPFWKGLAAAIIFGIVSSALLSLFLTPILYLWANTFTRIVHSIPRFASGMKKKIMRNKTHAKR